ncbi:MAG: YfiR family protein [Verrucomicrobiales bacterium]|nr:YfiR family protein [Verrucomicrobiales bacterium]
MKPRPVHRERDRSPGPGGVDPGSRGLGGTGASGPCRAAPRRLHARLGIGCLLFCALLAPLPSRCAPRPVGEYAVKAAFLLNFIRFVEWPSTAFADAKAPLVVGVFGDDPFGKLLPDTLADQAAHGRPLVVRYLAPSEGPEGCHLLFLARSVADSVDSLLEKTRNQPVVTVSECDRFVERGGTIGFVVVRDSVRFDVNAAAAAAAHLKISAKLLAVARSVVKAP